MKPAGDPRGGNGYGRSDDGAGNGKAATDRRHDLTDRLAQLLASHEALIQERQPALVRNCSGYYLRGVLTRRSLHVPRLLVGSEGPLALFTEATLHTAPLPAFRGVALLLFGQTEPALRSVQSIARQQPSACDLLDRRLLTLAREADPRFEQIITPTAEAALIVERPDSVIGRFATGSRW
jgi:FAD/FMN-containing dehydrogenase